MTCSSHDPRQQPQIRVGRLNGSQRKVNCPGFREVLCLTPSTPYGQIGPYCLKDDKGRIMENIYQSSKVYTTTPKTKQQYSRWDKRVIWERDEETHIISEDEVKHWDKNIPILHPIEGIKGKAYISQKYLKWRRELASNQFPVRYPVGMSHRKMCVGILTDEELDNFISGKSPHGVSLLGYIDGRKCVYAKVYKTLALKHPLFEILLNISKRENIVIVEVDGPHQESLPYYKEKYGVDDSFIVGDTILATASNLDIMLNDPKHPYGHGYVLADLLLEYQNKTPPH